MRGILIDPGCAPKIRKLPNTAQGLNAFLGGEVQIYRFGNVFAALVYTHRTRPCPTGTTLTAGTTGGCALWAGAITA